ncbi:hypothetical protein FNF31_02035 [Cafeteria roenbergensis]|uniref:Bifunctional lysine-specific demethylase and histidyl-hydroxylase n=1 Tax=Cafeteria roenbergensis TaxID=33653 RepID=A0A5A8DIN0_CAFRO|nr:hypothetical protein FNF31_02035 [Cafeteria roenbergensis]
MEGLKIAALGKSEATSVERAGAEVLEALSDPDPVVDIEMSADDYKRAPALGSWDKLGAGEKAGSPSDPPEDPREVGNKALEWLLFPMPVDAFFRDCWEQRPLIIRRHEVAPDFNAGLLSLADIRGLIEAGRLTYEDDLDVTSYKDGKRSTHNGTGVVPLSAALDNLENRGRSLRMLCPHAHLRPIYGLLSALEDGFGAFTGSNSYLTPAGTQGFAPHYDDIEAFLVQTEGAKRWRVYRPLSASTVLPRFSSRNFGQEDIGSPVLEAELRTGDLLYLPRGWIHQAVALPGCASLHLTVSTAMRFTWKDLVSLALEAAVEAAAAEDPALNRTLPRNMMDLLGVMRADDDGDKDRAALLAHAKELVATAVGLVDTDAAADQMARRFLRQRLPPLVDPATAAMQAEYTDPAVMESVALPPPPVTATAAGSSSSSAAAASSAASAAAADEDAASVGPLEFGPASVVRLAHPRATRMTVEAGECVVYHAHTNSVRFEGAEEGRLVFDIAVAPAVEALVRSYPGWLPALELPVMEVDSEDEGGDSEEDGDEDEDEAKPDSGRAVVLGMVEELVREGALVLRTLA